MEQPKKVVKKPLSMLKQKEDCGWDDDDNGGFGKLVAADSYNGYDNGDGKDVDDDDASSCDQKRRKMRKTVDDEVINPEEYPLLGMLLRLNYLDEELQKNCTAIGKHIANMLQCWWIKIMNQHMDLAAKRMDVVEDAFLLIQQKAKLLPLASLFSLFFNLVKFHNL